MNEEEYFSLSSLLWKKKRVGSNINKLSDPYIKQGPRKEENNLIEKEKVLDKNDIGMTYHSQPLEPDKNFKFFHDYITKKSRWCLDDMGYDMSNYNLIFTESWVQEFSENGVGHHWFHTHSNNHISGFFF